MNAQQKWKKIIIAESMFTLLLLQPLFAEAQTASVIKQISVGKNADGRIEVFGLAEGGAVYHIWQTTPNGGWGQWSSLAGHSIKQTVSGRNADGRLELFALGGDGAVYHIWQTTPNGGWGQWSTLAGHSMQQIASGSNADGCLELFALGGDGAVYHIWQATPNGGWGQWSSLAGHDLKQIAIGSNVDGRVELFALGGDGVVYHKWQVVPNGDWGEWSTLAGHDLKQIAIGSNADGRLELFALGGDGAVYHKWQVVPNGDWGEWSTLAGHDLKQIAIGSNADSRVELFALGGDGAVYHKWQVVPNGDWGEWASLGKPGSEAPPLQVLSFVQPPPGAKACPVPAPVPTQVTSGIDHPDVFDYVSCFMPRPNVEVWSIRKPNVTQPEVGYPAIRFRKGDLVTIAAGGCVQRGGAGFTTQRYVNPMAGDRNADNSHYGSVYIPGVITPQRLLVAIRNGPISIRSDPGPDAYLRLQYKDDGYQDNGYWSPDWGYYEQCRDMEEAWVVVIIQHGCADASGADCSSAAPMDLVSTEVDENGLLLNPGWGWQTIVGSPAPASQLCNWSYKSGGMPEDGVELCTRQSTQKNTNLGLCMQEGTRGRIAGHVNWQPATYNGTIQWYKHSAPAADNDDNFYLAVPNESGYAATNQNLRHGIVCEFDAGEVTYRAQSTWWRNFQGAVDRDDGCDDKQDPNGCEPGRLIYNKNAIVIGLVGLDCGHADGNYWTELHPVYAMAIHTRSDPNDDVWAVFARNFGNEGYCSQGVILLNVPEDRVTLNLPAPEGGPWTLAEIPFGPGLSELKYSHSGMGFSHAERPGGVTVTFTLRPPSDGSLAEGELHLRWVPR